jgi:hypothetical protein
LSPSGLVFCLISSNTNYFHILFHDIHKLPLILEYIWPKCHIHTCIYI